MYEERFYDQQLGITGSQSTSVQEGTLINIILPPDETGDYYKQVTAEVTVNLLARVFREVSVIVPEGAVCCLPGGKGLPLKDYLSTIPEQVREWQGLRRDTSNTINIVIGSEKLLSGGAIYINCDGWLAFLGQNPIKIDPKTKNNPVGAIVAACLGAAEVFKVAFGPLITIPPTYVDKSLVFSAFSYKVADYSNWQYLDNPEIGPPVLNDVTVFGVGSIGSSMLYSLSFIPDLMGTINVVDPDLKLDVHNLLRYSLLTLGELRQNSETPFVKANWAKEKMIALCPNLVVNAFVNDASGYISELPHDYKIDVAVSAVDGIPPRRDITDVMGRQTINAASGATNIEITRHRFNDGMACLFCRYVNSKSPLSQVQLYSEMTGLSPERIVQLLAQEVLEESDIVELIEKGKINEDESDKWIGNRLSTLVNNRLYGQVALANPGEAGVGVVTVAFVSLMAGALLAGELLKAKSFSWEDSWDGNLYQQDLLHRPNEIFMWEPSNEKCLCNHSFRQMIYRKKYSAYQ